MVKLQALEEEARGKLIARHLDAAERKRAEGNCNEAKKSATAVLAIDAESRAHARQLLGSDSAGGGDIWSAPGGPSRHGAATGNG